MFNVGIIRIILKLILVKNNIFFFEICDPKFLVFFSWIFIIFSIFSQQQLQG
jgi:hypothetical protein